MACSMSARAWCRTVAGFLLCVDGAGCPGAASGCGNRLNSQRFRVVEGDGAGLAVGADGCGKMRGECADAHAVRICRSSSRLL